MAGVTASFPRLIFLPWRNDVPLVRAVGAEETAELHRQSTLLGAHWPLACERELIEVPGCNHLSVCDAFADTRSQLYQATRDLAFLTQQPV